MMGGMDDLVQFLRARLDEDEQAAKALCNDTRPGRIPQWVHCDDGAIRDTGPRDPVLRVRFTWSQEAAHIVRHGPARVLAEVDAKRRLLEVHKRDTTYSFSNCVSCDAGEKSCGCMGGSPYDYPCETLRLLALPYADHPGYRDSWRPDA